VGGDRGLSPATISAGAGNSNKSLSKQIWVLNDYASATQRRN
jgi:hypothetical protein